VPITWVAKTWTSIGRRLLPPNPRETPVSTEMLGLPVTSDNITNVTKEERSSRENIAD
jgi:hypothetical protein